MGFITNLKWSISKRLRVLKKAKVWKKHGDETRFHFDNPDIEIGTHTYGIPNVIVYDLGIKLKIGRYCSIANDVKILLGGGHNINYASTFPFYYREKSLFQNANTFDAPDSADTIIGNDVWIGNGVTILSGKTIGDGAVIGAGAVVSKDIPPYAIAVGNPIRIIKYRFDEETISKLIDSEWWNLPEDKINEALPYLNDVNKFLKKIKELNQQENLC